LTDLLSVEIVSGSDFEGQQLYLNYQVKIPSQGWELRTGDINDGIVFIIY
jgi:hypothetical protein